MGKTYWFECEKCGYRAKAAGKTDQGQTFHVQTVMCRDCRQLYDAVVKVKEADLQRRPLDNLRLKPIPLTGAANERTTPPTFEEILLRLPPKGGRQHWVRYRPTCPVSPLHRVEPWKHPGKCPRCGIFLEMSALPFRLWD